MDKIETERALIRDGNLLKEPSIKYSVEDALKNVESQPDENQKIQTGHHAHHHK